MIQNNRTDVAGDKEPLRPNLTTKAMEPPHDAQTLRPNPKALFAEETIDLKVLKELAGKSILSVKDFSRSQVVELCKFAAFLEAIEVASSHPLDGKLVITAFFEASTRTRTSFESSVLRLDGKIISIPDASITGVKKGESMGDIGEMFNAYGDLVIMRHTRIDAIEEIRQNLRVPLINAGNGSGEHPTQSLADWYALLKWNPALALEEKGRVNPLHLGILGTPDSMRAVKSFLLMTLLFKENFKKISIVSEMADPLGPDLTAQMEAAGIAFEVINDLQEVIGDLDVIYMNSIALLGGSYQALDTRYKLTSSTNLKENAVILHPLSRLEELDTSLDDTRHNLYFSQAHGSVFVRQALLISIFDRFDRLPKSLPLK